MNPYLVFMSDEESRTQNRHSIGLLSRFRFFLWLGSETMKKVWTTRRPRARVQRLSISKTEYPVSSWVFQREMIYCLVAPTGQKEVLIYEMPKIGIN
jgi:hypothetical protein